MRESYLNVNDRTLPDKWPSLDRCGGNCCRGDNHSCRVTRSSSAQLAGVSGNTNFRPRPAISILPFTRSDDLRLGRADDVFPNDQSDRPIISLRYCWLLRRPLPADCFTDHEDCMDCSCGRSFLGYRMVPFSTGDDQPAKSRKGFLTRS